MIKNVIQLKSFLKGKIGSPYTFSHNGSVPVSRILKGADTVKFWGYNVDDTTKESSYCNYPKASQFIPIEDGFIICISYHTVLEYKF